MNKEQFEKVMTYIDTEYAGIIRGMTEADRKKRTAHWASEIGTLDFDAAMKAVRKLSHGPYMPRTAEVIDEVQKQPAHSTGGKMKCMIFRDAKGEEVLDLRMSNGNQMLYGYLRNFPSWMQIKFRWMADPNPENTLAWDNYILEYELEYEND